MKPTELKNLINDFREIELRAHVNLDDVLNKVTQEVSELVEAIISWNREETNKEAADSIVNIISASNAIWLEFEDSYGQFNLSDNSKDDFSSLFINLWKWNQSVQALRKRYSRDIWSLDKLQESTNELIQDILAYVDQNIAISDIIASSIKKFSSRVDAYKEQIDLWDYIDNYSDFPKDWIEFKDISPILKSEKAMKHVCYEIALKCKDADVIAWLDARWFLFGPKVAEILWKPFVMIRKKWKLPGKTVWIDYSLEYGKNEIEIQDGVLVEWQKVAILDDLLATWGTMIAASSLVEKLWWVVNNIAFVISLDEEGLKDCDTRKEMLRYPVSSVVSYS